MLLSVALEIYRARHTPDLGSRTRPRVQRRVRLLSLLGSLRWRSFPVGSTRTPDARRATVVSVEQRRRISPPPCLESSTVRARRPIVARAPDTPSPRGHDRPSVSHDTQKTLNMPLCRLLSEATRWALVPDDTVLLRWENDAQNGSRPTSRPATSTVHLRAGTGSPSRRPMLGVRRPASSCTWNSSCP